MAFNLPTPEGDPGAAITGKGFVYLGETIPFHEIKMFKATSDDELEVSFRTDREPLEFGVDTGCSHQLLDLKTFVETALMQNNIAVFDAARENVVGIKTPDGTEVEGIEFDMKKVRRSFQKAFSIGG
jgi:hypothetical protein